MFARSPTFIGYASWGRPDVDDVTELLRLCEIGIQPGVPPHRFLVDVRGLELIDPATFGLFLSYTRRHGDVLKQNIIGQAQLRPDGLVGAIISGFSHIASLPYPERVFGDVDDALTWLGVDHVEGTDVLAELDAIRHASAARDHVVMRLRTELHASGTVPVDQAARGLGLSTRALQRALRQAGTAYRIELKSFQIRRAQELLRKNEQSLAAIAGEVGFSSAQHFSTAFRRAIGDTPSAWRARYGQTG
jgi:AraC-like DNA-binding protein